MKKNLIAVVALVALMVFCGVLNAADKALHQDDAVSVAHDAHHTEYHPTEWVQWLASGLFALAVLHTFMVGKFRRIAHHYPEGSMGENFFHLLGEVEAVFLMWAAALFMGIMSFQSWQDAIGYIEARDYTEPKFVLAIMTIAATRPVIELVDTIIRWCARMFRMFLPMSEAGSFLFSSLTIGSLLGSFVTEPAAMTVTALVLKRQFFDRNMSKMFMYGVLGTLFVNVSIGGTLSNFAAPPVLMVAKVWGWSTSYMLLHFGWKAAVSTAISAGALIIFFRKELSPLSLLFDSDKHNGVVRMLVPWWVKVVHVAALAFTVLTSHHADVFFGGFVLFLGFCAVTKEFQEPLKLKEGLLVGGFLAGLVTMGGLQDWWLRPLLASLSEFPLFVGATALTAVTDNAALTYLGSQVDGLSEGMKYALVAGAVTGGGLTVIANAPNPAGYSVLNPSFESRFGSGISPGGLFLGALFPTTVAFLLFWLLP